MKRPVKLTLWLIAALFALLLAAPPILSATQAEAKYLCAQCHSMEHEYRSFVASKHNGQITCSDCHVAHGVSGLAAKYSDGARHVVATLAGAEADEIRITPHALQTVLANCITCHADVEHATQPDSKYCMSCHAEETHGALPEPGAGK